MIGMALVKSLYSDPGASWGHRSAVSTRKGGGYYGWKLHMAVCTDTGLPVAWSVETARSNESIFAMPLLDAVRARGFAADTCAMDKGYDLGTIYEACEARGCRPIIPLRQTTAVARGDHLPPTCEHGEWRFAGSDYQRGAAKWRCPTGECKPARLALDQGRPSAPTDSARDAALAQALQGPAPPSSANSAGSSTSGRSRRCA